MAKAERTAAVGGRAIPAEMRIGAVPSEAEDGSGLLALDPSVEAFSAGCADLLLKLDEVSIHLSGPAAARLAAAGADASWHALARPLEAKGLLARARGEPALNLLTRTMGPRASRRLRLVETHSFLRPDLPDVMQARDGAERVAIRFGAGRTWISPVFTAGAVPCWTCFVRRLAAQDDFAALCRQGVIRLLPPIGGRSVLEPAAARAIAGALDALEAGDWLIRIDHRTGERRRHRVRHLPDCPCAGLPALAPAPFPRGAGLNDRVAAALGDGLQAVTGTVSPPHLLPREPGDPVHVAVAGFSDLSGRLGAWTVRNGGLRRSGRKSRSAFGAGLTAQEACGKAALEAVERHCAICRGDEPVLRAPAAALGAAAVYPGWSERGTPDAIRTWLPARRLDGDSCFLPAETVLAGWSGGEDSYRSNGSATSFTREEAIVRGFLESVERDAIAIWWYNRIARPRIDWASFGDAFVDAFMVHQQRLGRSIDVFDVTSDLGIPVFAALARTPDEGPPIFGFAARFDASEALAGALLELGQALHFIGPEQARWPGFDWATQSQLAPAGELRRASDYRARSSAGLEACRAIARGAALDIVLCDHSRDDVALPVVQIIVPQLLLPGPPGPPPPARLVEVPVKLGWLSEPTRQADLNPHILPL